MQAISVSPCVPRAVGLNCREAVEGAEGCSEIYTPEDCG